MDAGWDFQKLEVPAVGAGLLPPAPSSIRPHFPCRLPDQTWIGSLSEAPGNEWLERTSCPRSKLQCVCHGPGPRPAPRRPHTLCVKFTDSRRPARRSSNRAAAIPLLRSPLAWRPLVAERRESCSFRCACPANQIFQMGWEI